jgi:glutamate-ammonia-ligase adenylyltransferase
MIRRQDRKGDLQRLESEDVLRTLADLMGVSRFLWEDFLRLQHENLFPVLADLSGLCQSRTRNQFEVEIDRELESCSNLEARVAALNQYKDREMFRVDLRHITGRIDFQQFSRELTDLAEATVAKACELALAKTGKGGSEGMQLSSAWCACALGKFGGRELGFASDIELVFVYNANGIREDQSAPRSRIYEEMVSEFLRILTARQQGIFEIDMRLRPYGKAGSLATSLSAFERYFSADGDAEQFERLALVKLRPVAGDSKLGARIVEARDGFVYSGAPVDYENLLYLRHRQATELVPAGVTNAKYSKGGLVDIEYFVQARQIEVGSTNTDVRVSNTIQAIKVLSLPNRFYEAYSFFRRLTDALRVVRGNAMDLTLPPDESQEFAYLSRRLHYELPLDLKRDIQGTMDFARNIWEHRT